MANEVIQVTGLTKAFDELIAVNNANFMVSEGEVFGFLGPNGAGKTTTINMLTTVLKPSAGSARVCGFEIAKEPRNVRRCIGVVPQEYTADEDLTGEENLMICAQLYDVPKEEARNRIEELLNLVQLQDARSRKVETYSGGMRRRLELAAGLINHPKVLFLDEPTLGLDVQTRTAVWEYIRLLKERYKMTLFMTTHYLEEADAVCDRIAIIDHGRIVVIDTPQALKDRLGGDVIEIRVEGGSTEELAASLRQISGVREVTQNDGTYKVKALNGDETAPEILDKIHRLGLKITRISLTKPTLDEAYLELTGKSLRDEEGSRDDSLRRRVTLRRART